MAVIERFLQPPQACFFLFGPRGTGKSTWLAQQFPQALRLDLLAPEMLRAYQARPERLRERIAAEPAADTVVIDEIQKAPQLLDVVHALLEQRSGLRFVLTASSGRIDKRDLAGLKAFRVDYPQAQRWLLSLAPEPLLIDGIRCEPLEPWLRQLRP